jgi:tRNA threonylcarbamoyladenosine biosynthesis protein TsaE
MGNERQIELATIDATQALGRRVAKHLAAGDVVCLLGELGAGKTTFARAIIAALCGIQDAPSPTYTIIQSYDTAAGTPLWHADLYRIEDEGELAELGLDDAFDDGITLIEWPDRLGRWTPANRLEIALTARIGAQHEPGLDFAREARLTGWGIWEDRIDDI